MKLMIIESPGKIKKLESILGDGFKIMASYGHIRDLPVNDLGVNAPDFAPKYEFIPGAAIPGKPGQKYPSSKDRVDRMIHAANDADEVFLATDPDREGESISWHLQQCLKLKAPKRVTFNEITATAVKTAMTKPRTIDIKLVAAQEARRVLDRLVGYMVSPAISLYAGENLSAGRVQSVAVLLVVERERAIRAFRVTNHFGVKLIFAHAKNEGEPAGRWVAEWQTKPDFATEDNPYFMDRDFAEKVANVRDLTVTAFVESEAKRSPPPPFSTSLFQQAASVSLGLNPKAAMDAAQKLYEGGHITYMRTDNPNVSDEALPEIYAVAMKLGLDMADKPRRFKAPDGAQEGHPAITPTHWEIEEAGETPEQRAVYKMIRLRAIACQLADARFAVRTVKLSGTVAGSGEAVQFEAKGRTLIYPGWLKLTAKDEADEGEDDNEPTNPIPLLKEGAQITADSGELLAKKTKPPSRYTEASLIKKLESEGVGRPATYAAIMDTIVRRGYVELDGKFLTDTPTGEGVVDALTGKFQFMDLGYTREVEHDFDRIASSEASYKGVVSKVYAQLENELSALHVSAKPKHPCPACGKPMRRIPGKKGFFWGCSGHPVCSQILPDDGGKPGKKTVQEVSSFVCEKCSKPLVHRVKKGAGGFDFWGCTGFKEGCKATYENNNGSPVFAASK